MLLHDDLVGVSSSPETAALHKALCQAQKKYKPIKRSGKNEAEGFTFSTLRDICDALMPGLLDNGFAMPTFATGYDRGLGQWVMVGTLTHESGEWVSSVCPLLMGWPDHLRPSLRELEIDCTYAKKVLMQGLCGGWPEGADDAQPQATVVVDATPAEPPALPTPSKQKPGKRAGKAGSDEIIERAEAALSDKAGDPEAVAKILEHLKTLVEEGRVQSSAVTVLMAKHRLGARVTKVIEPEVQTDAD